MDQHRQLCERFMEILKDYKQPLIFENFIDVMRDKLRATLTETEEAFWSLLDNGTLYVTHDYYIKLK